MSNNLIFYLKTEQIWITNRIASNSKVINTDLYLINAKERCLIDQDNKNKIFDLINWFKDINNIWNIEIVDNNVKTEILNSNIFNYWKLIDSAESISIQNNLFKLTIKLEIKVGGLIEDHYTYDYLEFQEEILGQKIIAIEILDNSYGTLLLPKFPWLMGTNE